MISSSDEDFGFREEQPITKLKGKSKSVQKDLDDLEELIITFLENIKSVPDKNGTLTIKWPSRSSDIDANIQKVKDITNRIRSNT